MSRVILDSFKAKDWYKVANPAMVEGKYHPLPKLLEVKVDMLYASLIKERAFQRCFGVNVLKMTVKL